MEQENTLFVGLCMAGAVSAGAYTAGVMDFLIEALEEWEKQKKSGDPDIPTHQVKIPVIGGASAGGMTGIITANGIQNEFKPIRNNEDLKLAEENPFYDAWVNLSHDDMFAALLSLKDIQRDKKVKSLFNSDFIDQVAEKSIRPRKNQPKAERPYFSSNLKVFTTLTNLNGIASHQEFNANIEKSSYYIFKHSDYACFEINSKNYKNDGWVPLDFSNEEQRKLAIQAAKATGAFPLGLKARPVQRKSKWVNDNLWHKEITKLEDVKGENYETLNADGGTINNEPFELLRDALNESVGLNEDDSDYSKIKSTILMIDPFPSETPNEDPKKDGILYVVGSLFTTMINHLRFEPKRLADSHDPNDASKYLIAPVRYLKDKEKIEGEKAISCGFMEGFGGFIHKDFRVHDFFLGRANCEQFLREHFTIPKEANNPIITEGYKDVEDLEKYTSKNGKLQIIPVFKNREDKEYIPEFSKGEYWPRIEASEIEKYKYLIKKRIGKITMNLVKLRMRDYLLLWVGNRAFIRRRGAKVMMEWIKKEMKDWDLLKK